MTTFVDETQIASIARAHLILNTKPSAAFLATLLMQLNLVMSNEIQTAQTDATTIWWNLEFFLTLTPGQRIFVIAHEGLHCGLLHIFRRGSRDPKLYNIAADHVVNLMLIKWGYEAPPFIYADPKFEGMGVEQVYSILYMDNPPENQKQPGNSPSGKSGNGKPQPGKQDSANGSGSSGNGKQGPKPSILPGISTGDFTDPDPAPQNTDKNGEPGPPPMTAEDWGIVAEQAAMAARAAGLMSTDMDGLLEASRKPVNDWENELKQYATQSIISMTSFSRPNRRFLGGSVILPGPIKEGIGTIAICVDTSGSTRGKLLQAFADNLANIIGEVQPEKVFVLYIDAAVKRVDVFEPGDDFELHSTGGGGTRFQPAFDYIEQEGIDPLVCIYLTDLHTSDRPIPPAYPVIWCTPNYITKMPPFDGPIVRIEVQ